MKKLSKEQVAEIGSVTLECSTLSAAIQERIEEYNNFVGVWKDGIEEAISYYNEKLSALREVYEHAANDAQEYFDERSDTWQEGDKGQVYAEWINELESFDSLVEDLDIEVPDTLADPDFPDWDNPENWLPQSEPGA